MMRVAEHRPPTKEFDGVDIIEIKATITTLNLLSALSFGAGAAVIQVDSQEVQNLQSIGSVSVSQIDSSPMDMCQAVTARAEKAGASSYRVTEFREGAHWHATAELYK